MNAEDAYLRNGLADLAQIWNWSARTPRESAQNKIVFVQGVLSYRSMKMALSLLVSVVRSRFLGPHDATMCLDSV